MKLALGTAQFGMPYGISNQTGQVPAPEVRRILETARVSRIDTLDTAVAYGSSEACLGQAGAQDWRIVTKLPPLPADCPDIDSWVRDHVQESLKRLGLDKVYALLLHRGEDLLGEDGTAIYTAMDALKREGLIDKLGVSIYTPTTLQSLFTRFHLDLVQAPFNVVDRRLYASGWLDELKRRGTEVHVRSAFMQGLLLMPTDARPAQFSPWSGIWAHWDAWLQTSGQSAPAACLAFLRSFAAIDRIIVGVENAGQLKVLTQEYDNGDPNVPDTIQSEDLDLIDPSKWRKS